MAITRHFAGLSGALSLSLLLGACAVDPYYGSGYYRGGNYGVGYYGGGYSGGSYGHGHYSPGNGYSYGRSYGGYHAVVPYPVYTAPRAYWSDRSSDDRRRQHRHHSTERNPDRRHDSAQLRDWRQGDGDFRRRQRMQSGDSLGDRTRLDRQERIRESRQDRADQFIGRRGAGQIAIEGAERPRFSPPQFDEGASRRLDRAAQTERRAQRRASEVRRRLAAEQRAERENLIQQ